MSLAVVYVDKKCTVTELPKMSAVPLYPFWNTAYQGFNTCPATLFSSNKCNKMSCVHVFRPGIDPITIQSPFI